MNEKLLYYHGTLLKYMRERESNTFQFLGTLISAAGFGWMIKTNLTFEFFYLFMLICLVLLSWGIFVSIYFSYAYRCFQVILSKIEEKTDLKKILPEDWIARTDYKTLDFIPEIYKGHILSFLFLEIIITVGVLFEIWNKFYCLKQKLIYTIAIIITLFFIFSIYWKILHYYVKKYKKITKMKIIQ